MSRAQVDAQLDEVIAATHPDGDWRCWGWGARAIDHFKRRCVDGCGNLAELDYPDGARCWRCGLWYHLGRCPA